MGGKGGRRLDVVLSVAFTDHHHAYIYICVIHISSVILFHCVLLLYSIIAACISEIGGIYIHTDYQV